MVKTQTFCGTYLIRLSSIGEESVKSFIHDRWTTYPQPFNAPGAADLFYLSRYELFIPSPWIDTLLRKSNVQTEAVLVVPFAVRVEGFKKLQSDRLSSIRKGYIQEQLESVGAEDAIIGQDR